MKPIFLRMIGISLCGSAIASAQASGYVNFICQSQENIVAYLDPSLNNLETFGSKPSGLLVPASGATFDLHSMSVASPPPVSFPLTSLSVGAYMPMAQITILSEDKSAVVPRTRADRAFSVNIKIAALRSGATDPEAAKRVRLLHYVQSYGVKGTGVGIDTSQATKLSDSFITNNYVDPVMTLPFPMHRIPCQDLTKARGEHRFEVWSIEDKRVNINGDMYTVPPKLLASQKIQIWPVADGKITGITPRQRIRYQLPQVTFTMNDLYPNSTTYAQVYKGEVVNDHVVRGTQIAGPVPPIGTSPRDAVEVINGESYAQALDSDGVWTMELLTVTPFITDRLDYVTFEIDRTMKVNGNFVTIE